MVTVGTPLASMVVCTVVWATKLSVPAWLMSSVSMVGVDRWEGVPANQVQGRALGHLVP
jgi:hypothetical protein